MDIEKILQKIRQENDEKIAEIARGQEEEINRLIFDAREKSTVLREKQLERAKRAAEKYRISLVSNFKLEMNKKMLKEKRRALDECFSQALKTLKSEIGCGKLHENGNIIKDDRLEEILNAKRPELEPEAAKKLFKD